METTIRESSIPAALAPLPNEPLQIRVTQPALENVVLRALIRQAIPMLRNPEHYGKDARCGLAQTLAQAVKAQPRAFNVHDRDCIGDVPDGEEPPHTDADAPPEAEQGYESCLCNGCCGSCGGCQG